MSARNNKSHILIKFLLEILGIIQRTEDSRFSTRGFIIYRVYRLFCSSTMFIAACSFVIYAPNDKKTFQDKLRSVVMATVSLEFLMFYGVLLYKRRHVHRFVTQFEDILNQIDANHKDLDIFYERNYKFVRIFSIILSLNLLFCCSKAGAHTYLSGESHYPFELFCFGLPYFGCWALQILVVGYHVVEITVFFGVLKTAVNQLTTFSLILASMFKTRPTIETKMNDKKLCQLYANVASLGSSISNIYGPAIFIELLLTAVRNCAASYHVIKTIADNELTTIPGTIIGSVTCISLIYLFCACGEDLAGLNTHIDEGIRESKWYAAPPDMRKPIILMLGLNKKPIRLHFKQHLICNMMLFGSVVQSVYTLTTVLANFM